METRNEKSKASLEKTLEVKRAEATHDQIRFYVNDNSYVAVKSNEDGSYVEMEGNQAADEPKKSILKIISVYFSILIMFLIDTVFLAAVLYKSANFGIILLCTNIIVYFTALMYNALQEFKNTDFNLRSKHSAEHMLVNFLESNKRLPRNCDEILETSRFSNYCGSRFLVIGFSDAFVLGIISSVIIILFNSLNIFNGDFEIVIKYLVELNIYILIMAILSALKLKIKGLYKVITMFKNLANRFVQYGNTTSKVKVDDIFHAYHVASIWLKKVYPEFYSKEDVTQFYS